MVLWLTLLAEVSHVVGVTLAHVGVSVHVEHALSVILTGSIAGTCLHGALCDNGREKKQHAHSWDMRKAVKFGHNAQLSSPFWRKHVQRGDGDCT